ncbi:UDP-glycosyltransferase [Actinidia chinensis var. chinensis]|uniref:Glycosyltransferase n=1 Tax=Actinidia chinensis var. chinensis TaxID=1590841 RepID=A0A2R6PDN4_ACTCC|nr:UDP-glycosyltransferase [Actinidia chinensis var. chinensis]
MAQPGNEIFVVTSLGSGHLFPCIELCNLLSSRNYQTTLVLPSNLLLPSSFRHRTASIAAFDVGPHSPTQAQHQAGLDLLAHLEAHRPLCAVVDFQVGWAKPIFLKFDVPVVSLFTFGACAASMEWGAWKAAAGDLNSGEVRPIPGLPEGMCLTHRDLKPPSAASGGGGGPKPGHRPPWVPAIEGSIGLMFNTCEELEGPYLEYLCRQIGLPVWAVGPLLPEQYWESPSGSLIRDGAVREPKRESNYTEVEVIQWLDSKPRGSVLYVSFGSETGPTIEEYPELASALEDSTHPFIWVIQPGSGLPKLFGSRGPRQPSSGMLSLEDGYFPHDLASKVGDRGLIIRGWAPQLLILSHPSTGGFLSHCGWNSTVEAIGRGVPILAWPMRGDQIYNAKLVVNHLKIGYMAFGEDSSDMAKKDILEGVERLMSDREIRKRAEVIRVEFECGFSASSRATLDAFRDFVNQKEA